MTSEYRAPYAQATSIDYSISLTPELSRFVERLVRSGRYPTASALVREALCGMQMRERQHVAEIAALKADIDVGLEQLRRGESVDGDAFFAALRARREAAT